MKKLVNVGKLHRVKCDWCGLKMACNCFQGNHPDGEHIFISDGEHIFILCPKCQVTEF